MIVVPLGWSSIDDLPEVKSGLIGRDALYRAARERRISTCWVSKRRLLVRSNVLEELAANPPSEGRA